MKCSAPVIRCSAIVLLVLASCAFENKTSTSNSGSPDDVKFIRIPASVDQVAFWDDGNRQIATFAISEEEFKKIFPKTIIFHEIERASPYFASGYGDPKNPPFRSKRDAIAKSGLVFNAFEDDGGGLTAIFDRDRGVGFVYYAKW